MVNLSLVNADNPGYQQDSSTLIILWRTIVLMASRCETAEVRWRSTSLTAPALLMTMTDIAELAEVQRPVVTTWRRRHRGLPCAGGRRRVAAAVRPPRRRRLAARHGKGSAGSEPSQELSLFMLTGLAARYDGPDVIAAMTALLCLRFLAGESQPLSRRCR